MGIEPTWPAWKAGTLPLSYARSPLRIAEGELRITLRMTGMAPSCRSIRNPQSIIRVVVRGGFEPPKAAPADLQSAPFDRSGT